MTDPVHLSDEELSAVVDGAPGPAHLTASGAGRCGSCVARLEALGAARAAVTAAVVPPLSPATVGSLVAAAVAAEREGEGPAVPITGYDERRRRLPVPPPAWLVGAAAVLVVLAGLAGLVRSTADDRASPDGAMGTMSAEGAGTDASATAGGAAAAVVDPDVVSRDLGDFDEPAALTTALATTPVATAAAGTTAVGARAMDEEATVQESEAAPAAPAGGGGGPVDRARCRADAERIGAGRFGALQATATLRWAGRPAEVLVFALTEPGGGFTRQALVLARPGCALLADPRF